MAITKITKGKDKGKYRVRIQKRAQGKVIPFPSEVCDTKADAKKCEAKMVLEFDRLYPETRYGDLTQPLYKVLDQYIDAQWDLDRWSSKSTLKAWKYLARVIKKYLGNKRAIDVKRHDIDVWVHAFVADKEKEGKPLAISPHSSLAKMLQNLRKFFADMQEYGIQRNPVPIRPVQHFFRKDQQSNPREKRVFTSKEIKAITKEVYQELTETEPNYWPSRIAILLCLSCGFRPQEVQALRFSDLMVDPADGESMVFKVHDAWDDAEHALRGNLKSRRPGEFRYSLPIPPELYRLIKAYEIKQQAILEAQGLSNEHDFILLNMTSFRYCSSGYPITKHGMNDRIKSVCHELGMQAKNVSIYTCRHTLVTKLVNSPNNILSTNWLASRLGHTPETLRKYYLHEDKDISREQLAVTREITRSIYWDE